MRPPRIARIALALTMVATAVYLADTSRTFSRVDEASAQTATADSSISVAVPTQMMLVFDLSGSMSDTGSDARTKLDVAKTGMLQFVQDLPKSTQLGLWTYPGGTTDSSGCSAGTARIGAGGLTGVDEGTMGATIRSLTANGDTPTGPALAAAARLLTGTGPRTIVLVSDGEENCGTNSCDVAKQLAAAGVDLSIYTIGFQISDTGRQALQCIADATGGQYADADSGQALLDALPQLAKARLEVRLTYAPSEVAPAIGSGHETPFEIRATVTNVGANNAADVQITLSFDAEASAALGTPKRRLGNLAKGESREAQWTLRVPTLFADSTVRANLSALAANADLVTLKPAATILVKGGLTAANAGPLLAGRQRVAILGDSYSSGEGAPPFEANTDTGTNGCHRSPETYGMVLFSTKVRNFACSGAIASDITVRKKSRVANKEVDDPTQILSAQVNQLDAAWPDQGPDLVLMTLGGNDIGFTDIILACILAAGYTTSPRATPITACDRHFEDSVQERLDALPSSLSQAYGAVDSLVNRPSSITARGGVITPIVVLAYPKPYADTEARRKDCGGYLSEPEMRWANGVVDRLNTYIESTVKKEQKAGRPIYFVDTVENAFQPGHTLCDGANSWVNHIKLDAAVNGFTELISKWVEDKTGILPDWWSADPIYREVKNSFHPNADGYRAFAASLLYWSINHPDLTVSRTYNCHCLQVGTADPSRSIVFDADGQVSVQPAGVYDLQASGLPPGSFFELQVRSSPVLAASGTVDDDGHLDATIAIPPDLKLGSHELVLVTLTPDGVEQEQAMRLDVGRPLAPWWLWIIGAFGLICLGLGAFVLTRDRRRVRAAMSTTETADG
jgi:lysophospholipase L1-like esterase